MLSFLLRIFRGFDITKLRWEITSKGGNMKEVKRAPAKNVAPVKPAAKPAAPAKKKK